VPPAAAFWVEIGPLLDEALDLPPQDLAPWLAELDVSRPDAARELRRLLDEKDRLDEQRFLETGPPLPPASLAGQRVGAYTLESLLGEGGMGTVWLASRSDGRFQARVAIKLLNVALVGRPSEQRFVREGNVLARLQHPNIAKLSDAGVAANGQPYLVLEYVPGERIDRYCKRRRLEISDRIRLFLDVLAAIEHAHNQLVVHRDLKPANILVNTDGVVKLLDFGIAALLAAKTADSDLTREVGSAHTPAYAAPEQLTGAAMTTATDVYSLGVILFLLLAGRHPLGGEGQTPAEILRRVIEHEAPAMSTLVEEPRLNRVLRGDLDNIVAKALKRNPAERYPTATAFADDLKRYLNHEPVQARPDSFTYRARKFLRRYALEVGASSIVLLLLASTAAFALWQMFDARVQRDNARFEARRAEASSEFMSLVFEEVGPTGTPLSLEQLLDRGVALLERQNGGDPAILAGMLVQASHRYADMGRVDKQLSLLARAAELATVAASPDVLASAECVGVGGEIERGRPAAARERLRLGEATLAKTRRPVLEAQVDCIRAAAEMQLVDGHGPVALSLLGKARAMLEAAGSTRSLQYTATLNDMGLVYYRTGRYADALAMTEQVAAAFERNGRGGTVGMTIVLGNTATILYQMGEVRAADERIRKNLAREVAAGSGRPHSLSGANRGSVLVRLEKFDEAQAVLESAAEIARADGNVDAEIAVLTYHARLHIRRGDLARAADVFRRIDDLVAPNPEAHRDRLSAVAVVRVEFDLARLDVASAHARADALLASIDYPRKRNIPILKALLPPLARLALLEHDFARAQAYATEDLALAQSVARPGGHSADVGEALLLECQSLQLAGHRAEARRDIGRAVENLEDALGAGHSLTREARALQAKLTTAAGESSPIPAQ
jgi:eukaryotic-like serine/threonine-protein kinase